MCFVGVGDGSGPGGLRQHDEGLTDPPVGPEAVQPQIDQEAAQLANLGQELRTEKAARLHWESSCRAAQVNLYLQKSVRMHGLCLSNVMNAS